MKGNEKYEPLVSTVILLLVVPATLLSAKVCAMIWAWTLAEYFGPAKPMAFVGVSILRQLLVYSKKVEFKTISEVLVNFFYEPLVALALVWIAKHFM